MPAPFDNIVQHLFHQPSLYSVTVDELEQMARQHPYFAAAHFLLLKKMQETDHPSFTDQLHKTTIYFNNPLWLQYLLQPETVTDFSVSEKAPFITNEQVKASPPVHEENAGAGDQPVVYQNEFGADQDNMMDVITQVFSEARNDTETVLPDPPPDFSAENNTPAFTENTTEANNEAVTENNNASAAEQSIITAEAPTISAEDLPAAEEKSEYPLAETIHESNNDSFFVGNINTDISASVNNPPESIAPADAEAIHETSIQHTAAGTTVQEENAADYDNTDGPAEEDQPLQADLNLDQATPPAERFEDRPLIKTIIETPAAKNDILFEPYHTVDYFASQGIKLTKTETESKDKLGRQLKSFTDWLKSMKKLPQVSIDKILAENEEQKVVEDANHSIENKEVVTEAMAEVFEKQGLHEKAADIYRKLSLLNPAKSAYFATRLEALKQ